MFLTLYATHPRASC